MRKRTWALLAVAAAAGLTVYAGVARAAPENAITPAEVRRIERLLDTVAKSTDRHFVRNGTAYDASTAARFLRAKWEHERDRIHSAEEFVREVGTRSSTTGNRYRVRGPDGAEEDSAEYLARELAR